MKLPLSLAGLALALSSAAPLTAQTLASWDSPVKAAASDGALMKSGGCEGCPDSGAHSVIQLTGEGYAEFVAAADVRVIAGLGTDLSAATDAATIDYAFSLWPGGVWELRERGVYRTEGSFAAGDRFRISVESGRIVYRRNDAVVYTSTVLPSYPLVLDATLYSMNASITQASVVITSTVPVPVAPPPPPPVTPPAAPPVLATVGPYQAVTDRVAHAKPALPSVGPAGSSLADPVFMATVTRITDASTRPDTLDRSYRTPSSPHQNAWSLTGSRFYIVSNDGSVLPYTFDATTGSAQRVQPTVSGAGGLVLSFYIEPQFSYLRDNVIYGSYSGPGGTLRTIDQYDFTTASYSRLLDVDTMVGGLAGTYLGGVASSAGPTERVMTFFGGARQDLHHYLVVFDAANPGNRQLLDTTASTLNGLPAGVTLNFLLHHAMIDRSGRYVMLYPTSADQAGIRKAPQSVLWDTQSNLFTEMPVSALPYGHDAFGYGVSVNQDCCVATAWDAAQWQFRSLDTPLSTRDVIASVLSPQEVYLADHTTWNNAKSDQRMPFVSGLYRYGTNAAAWRAWDDEIVAVQTDAVAGADATVWRFAHHRSNVANDLDATRASFWYMPRPNVSRDGQWVLFTSNWEKTLGTDPVGEPGSGARQDVFLVQLRPAGSTTPPAPPPIVPVTIATSTLPSGRATIAYAASLQAAGGSGSYAWSVTGGALPAGLALDAATGAIGGVPQAAGSYAFTASVADAADAANTASALFTLAVGAPPVAVTTTSVPGGRLSVAYIAALQASGGSGGYHWSVVSGALPSGLALDASTGAIGGTPAATGTLAFSVGVTDASDTTNTATGSYSVVIGASPVRVTTTALPSGRVSVAYTAAEEASGGSGSVTWSVGLGALPAGLNLDATTGTVSGTPTASGTYAVTVAAADAADATNSATVTYSIGVAAAIKITSPRTLPTATRNVAYSYVVATAYAEGTVRWDLAGGTMPPGMTLDAASGVISGRCTTKGTWDFNARVKDASTEDTLTLTLTVKVR